MQTSEIPFLPFFFNTKLDAKEILYNTPFCRLPVSLLNGYCSFNVLGIYIHLLKGLPIFKMIHIMRLVSYSYLGSIYWLKFIVTGPLLSNIYHIGWQNGQCSRDQSSQTHAGNC